MCSEDQDGGLNMICLENTLSLKSCWLAQAEDCLSARAWEKEKKKKLLNSSFSFSEMVLCSSSWP